MRSEVRVKWVDQEFVLDPTVASGLSDEAARAWLDEQFLALECEPLRATGKLLRADKVLLVAQAAGVSRLGDAAWGAQFAAAAVLTLGKPLIKIDVPAMAVSF